MICKHCGNEIGEDAIFCPKCGEKNAKEDVEAEEGSKDRYKISSLVHLIII